MHNPAEFALARPRLIGIVTVFSVAYGILSYASLPRQENPRMPERHATITTYLPGAEPEKVELLVTRVIEDKVAEVDDLENIFSSSIQGRSWMMIEVDDDAPASRRLEQIRDRVREAQALLPAGASEPEIDLEVLRTNTLILALTGEGVAPEVLAQQAREWRRDLEMLPDVRRVTLLGKPEEEIEVAIDLRQLSQNGITLAEVISALATRNAQLPAGELEIGTLRSAIQTSGAFRSAADVASVYLGSSQGGLPVRLADVARIGRRLADPDVLVRWAGRPAVSLALEMLPGKNAIRFGERVRARVEARRSSLPEGMGIEVVADEPHYIELRLTHLTQSLLLGMVLVVLLVFWGLGWRSGTVVSLSIPLSLCIAMGFLGAADVTLHQISIAALVIAIGLVVDEAIVITDSIQRHLDAGTPPREAASRGLAEIHTAVIAGAATTIAAFVPLLMQPGDIGEFVRAIPLIVSLMLVASVAVAHYFTPLLCAALHARGRSGLHRTPAPPARYERVFHRALELVIRRTRLILGLFVLGLIGTLVLLRATLWPPVFFPPADRNQFLIEVYLPNGTPLEETDTKMREIEQVLRSEPRIRDWTAFIGAGAPKFYYNELTEGRIESRGMLIVNTDPALSVHATHDVARELEAALKHDIVGAFVRVKELQQGYGGHDDIEVYITGDDLGVLRQLAIRIRDLTEQVPGVLHARESFGYDPPTIEARINDSRANLLGIRHSELAAMLRIAIDGVTATKLQEIEEEIDITVRLVPEQRRSIADLETLPVVIPSSGRSVPLSHLASLVPSWTTRNIMRWNRKREAAVWADVEGRSTLTVTAEVERAVRSGVQLPPGYEAHFFGERREVRESMLSFARAALLAIFLIYAILLVQFRSLAQPLLVILAVPMAMVGSVLGLVVTGYELGFMAFLGMIALTGVVVNDSIVLMHTINSLRREGMELEDAVRRGAARRLRAIVLTSVTTIGGLLPLTLSGGAFWGSFGFVMIFGLAASTGLTLLVQPAAYLELERRRSGPRSGAARTTTPASSPFGISAGSRSAGPRSPQA